MLADDVLLFYPYSNVLYVIFFHLMNLLTLEILISLRDFEAFNICLEFSNFSMLAHDILLFYSCSNGLHTYILCVGFSQSCSEIFVFFILPSYKRSGILQFVVLYLVLIM